VAQEVLLQLLRFQDILVRKGDGSGGKGERGRKKRRRRREEAEEIDNRDSSLGSSLQLSRFITTTSSAGQSKRWLYGGRGKSWNTVTTSSAIASWQHGHDWSSATSDEPSTTTTSI
jgi:hypothetical protein